MRQWGWGIFPKYMDKTNKTTTYFKKTVISNLFEVSANQERARDSKRSRLQMAPRRIKVLEK